MNYEKEVNSLISSAINCKDEKKYIEGVKKALIYFLNDDLPLSTLDSVGSRYLPYMEISEKFTKILDEVSSLEVHKNPKKTAKKCLIRLNETD